MTWWKTRKTWWFIFRFLRIYEYRSKSTYVTFCDFRYESGDHVAVFPTNDSALVNKLGQILGVDLDLVISLNNLDGMALKPCSTLTLQSCPSNLLTKTFLDISACSISSLNAYELDCCITAITCYCCNFIQHLWSSVYLEIHVEIHVEIILDNKKYIYLFFRGVQQEAPFPLSHHLPHSPHSLPGHHTPSSHQCPLWAGTVRLWPQRPGEYAQDGLFLTWGQGQWQVVKIHR